MRLLALDLGDKTIGVAATDELGLTAQPVKTIRRTNMVADLGELSRIAAERGTERVVLGLPINMDDTEGPRALKSRRFAEVLREKLALPVVLWDERLTTWEAAQILIEQGVKPEKRKAIIDTVAAQVILRSYLDAGAPESGA